MKRSHRVAARLGALMVLAVLSAQQASAQGLVEYGPGPTPDPSLPFHRYAIDDLVIVDNPGNGDHQWRVPEFPHQNYDTGSVGYTYAMGTYEITAGEYTEFLNAVADSDPYGLYDQRMDVQWDIAQHPNWFWTGKGANILRSGSPGSYTYSVADDWAHRPVNYVDYGDAARYCNWLHNGKPTGVQDATTTEDGSYDMSATHPYYGPHGEQLPEHVSAEFYAFNDSLAGLTRRPGATYVIPHADEWYKAAHHKNDGVTANYWLYPTSSDTPPSNDLVDPDPGNNATFNCHRQLPDGSREHSTTLDGPYYRTEVGAHENTTSPYGAFDMGGNVFELTSEAIVYEMRDGTVQRWVYVRGGSWDMDSTYRPLRCDSMGNELEYPNGMFLDEDIDVGFRVAVVAPTGPTVDIDYTVLTEDSDLSGWSLESSNDGIASLFPDLRDGADPNDRVFRIHSGEGAPVSMTTPPVDLDWMTFSILVSFDYRFTTEAGKLEVIVGDQTQTLVSPGVMDDYIHVEMEFDSWSAQQVEFRLSATEDPTVLLDGLRIEGTGFVPEPASMGLLALGGVITVIRRRR